MVEVLPGTAFRDVVEVHGDTRRTLRDRLAEEVPVELRFDGVGFAVMMLTPCDLEDFAYGFALTERGIAPADVLSVEIHHHLEGLVMAVTTAHPAPAEERTLPGRTGCGICGSRRLEEVVKSPPRVAGAASPSPAAIDRALAELASRQPLNAATGAVHAAAWCDPSGALIVVREDVGRHNALDKLIGALQREGIATGAGFALVTSRASYEMVSKAALAGITALVALSAPTALAVDLAQSCGLGLIAFARPDRHVRYAAAASEGGDQAGGR